jgi:hypothetical protein
MQVRSTVSGSGLGPLPTWRTAAESEALGLPPEDPRCRLRRQVRVEEALCEPGQVLVDEVRGEAHERIAPFDHRQRPAQVPGLSAGSDAGAGPPPLRHPDRHPLSFGRQARGGLPRCRRSCSRPGGGRQAGGRWSYRDEWRRRPAAGASGRSDGEMCGRGCPEAMRRSDRLGPRPPPWRSGPRRIVRRSVSYTWR